MSAEDENLLSWPLLCLRISAEEDPSVLPRLLGYVQNLNVTPRRFVAEFGTNALMHLQTEVAGVAPARLDLIAAKAGQMPCVVRVYWHHV